MLNELQHNWSARHWRIPRRSRWAGGIHTMATPPPPRFEKTPTRFVFQTAK